MNAKGSLDKNYVLERLQSLCSRTEKCVFDIRRKLESYNISENDQEEILETLLNEKFIDDRRFAGIFTRDKFNLNRWGKLKIRYALYMKNINESIIDEVLDELKTEEYEQVLKELIKIRNKNLKDENLFTRKARLFRFASQKGFEPEIIYRLIDEVLHPG